MNDRKRERFKLTLTVSWGNFGQVGLFRTLSYFAFSRHRDIFWHKTYSKDYVDGKYANSSCTESKTNQKSKKLKCKRSYPLAEVTPGYRNLTNKNFTCSSHNSTFSLQFWATRSSVEVVHRYGYVASLCRWLGTADPSRSPTQGVSGHVSYLPCCPSVGGVLVCTKPNGEIKMYYYLKADGQEILSLPNANGMMKFSFWYLIESRYFSLLLLYYYFSGLAASFKVVE